MILPREPDLLIEKDIHGVIRELRHLQTPAEAEPGLPAKGAALEYLRLAALERRLLPLEQSDWDHLKDTLYTEGTGRSNKSRFRWTPPRELKRNSGIETTIVWCQQTVPAKIRSSGFVPDVQGSSIRLVVHHRQQPAGLQITSARLTTLEHADLSMESAHVERAFGRRLEPAWADHLPAELVLRRLAPVIGLDSTAGIAEARLVAYPRRGRSPVYDDGALGLAISTTIFLSVAAAAQLLIGSFSTLWRTSSSARLRSRQHAPDMLS